MQVFVLVHQQYLCIQTSNKIHLKGEDGGEDFPNNSFIIHHLSIGKHSKRNLFISVFVFNTEQSSSVETKHTDTLM